MTTLLHTHRELSATEPARPSGRGLKGVIVALTSVLVLAPILAHLFMGISFAVVSSASMEPAISVGDLEVVRPVSAAELSVGDVVLLKDEKTSSVYSHRIVELSVAGQEVVIHTRGDGNPTQDLAVSKTSSASQISRTVAVLPAIGKAIAFMTTTEGRILLVAFLVISELLLLVQRYNKNQKERRHD